MTVVGGVRIVLRIADGWVPPRLDEDGHHVLDIDHPYGAALLSTPSTCHAAGRRRGESVRCSIGAASVGRRHGMPERDA